VTWLVPPHEQVTARRRPRRWLSARLIALTGVLGCAHASGTEGVQPAQLAGCYVVSVRTDSSYHSSPRRTPATWMERGPGLIEVDTVALDSVPLDSLAMATGFGVPRGRVSWRLRVPSDEHAPFWWSWSDGTAQLVMATGFVSREYRLRPTANPDHFVGSGAYGDDTMERRWYSLTAERTNCLGYTHRAT
jgi:hypothetical protein